MVRTRSKRYPSPPSSTSKRSRPCADRADVSRASKDRADVSLRIAKQLLTDKKYKHSNVVLCPLSINVLLCLMAAGSEGETLDQFLDFLDSETLEDINSLASDLISNVTPGKAVSCGGPKISFASGVWFDRSLSIKDSFKQVIDSIHKAAALERVDFKNKAKKVTEEVNLWVEKETNGLIKEAIPEGKFKSFTRLVLANALYFKGAWDQPFEVSKTKNRDFHLLNGSTVQVPFMTNDKRRQLISTYEGFKVMKFPYRKGADKRRFSMCLYLPDEKKGLPALIKKLTSKPELLDSYTPYASVPVLEFCIPRFKISFGFEASEVLKSLGLTLPFSPEDAELTKMVDSPDGEVIYVTDFFHKSVIEINEEGTEAVAYSWATCGGGGDGPPPPVFVADHPFLFIIREDTTGVVLFIGSVVDPSAD